MEKRKGIAQVSFLGMKEHIILLIVAGFTLPYLVHVLVVLIQFHNICSSVVGSFRRENID